MTKETPELLTECWQLLVEYIPRRDHGSAAEQFVTFLESVLDKDELRAMADLDTDISNAYDVLLEESAESDSDLEMMSNYDDDE